MDKIITQENFNSVLEWISNPLARKPEYAQKFMAKLNDAYKERLNTTNPAKSLTIENLMTEAQAKPATDRRPATSPILDMLTQENEKQADKTIGEDRLPLEDENGYKEAGMDSMTLAGAIAWHYAKIDVKFTHGRPLSMNFLQFMMYIIYGTILAERKTRLVKEHPQMWEFGPIFARAYTKLRKSGIEPKEEQAKYISENDPTLAEFIPKILKINLAKGYKEMKKEHLGKSSPWEKTNRENPGKWSTEISDTNIENWFAKRIRR